MGANFIDVAGKDRRVTVTLNRPPLNILNLSMLEQLRDALERIATDSSPKVLLLRGAGKAFSAGVDVADHTAERAPPMLRLFHDALLRLVHLDAITVAQVHGACLGGGLELALACDLVYAAEDATLGQPEIQLAAFPSFGAAMYPALLGTHRAAELIFTGRSFSGKEAVARGIGNAIYPKEALASEVEAVCSRIEGYSGVALKWAKRAMRGVVLRDVEASVARVEQVYLEELLRTEDAKEGVQAFLEKRTPRWRDE